MRSLLWLLVLSLFCIQLMAQNHTISGFIKDSKSGEVLIGATVYISTLKKGAISNDYGFYSLSIPETDSVTVAFTYIGYVSQIKRIALNQDIQLDLQLKMNDGFINEVVISADRPSENVERPQMGIVDVPISKIKELPAILGEIDVLKVVQLLPGVQAGNEGTTGFFVRGGGADQNLVLLDEAIVYNPNHLFGLFSTFNARSLNHVSLIKGGFPAQYGGRLSSILDVKMKEGNNRKLHGEGGIGLITSQLTLEGPIKKEKASFIVSARRTYLDLIAKPFLPRGNKSNYNFYDLNAKVNWQISPKDRLYLSGFTGRDNAEYKAAQGINYRIVFGNSTGTLRWNHLFGPKLFLNTSLLLTTYEQDISAIQDNAFSQVYSGIRDISGKTAFHYYPNPNHSIQFGINYTDHKFLSRGKSATQSDGNPNPGIDINQIPAKRFSEVAAYFNDEFSINSRLSANIGIRAPAFVSKEVNYLRLEPRANLKYSVGTQSSVKASYTLMNQFIHLIPSSTASVPTDVWIASSERTLPQVSQQFALGYFQNFAGNQYESSLEFYYKTMNNQALFQEGTQLFETVDIDNELVYGKGWSYGAELFIKKNTGKLTGWISYTLSWTYQQFDDLNFGEKFPFRYDRRHNLSLVGNYSLSERWKLSGVFIFTSGSLYTLPVGRLSVYQGGTLFEGNYFVYEGRNNARLGTYHRLDLSLSYVSKQRKLFKNSFQSEWIIGAYNIYSRQNPYFIYYLVDPVTNQPKARQVSLLPIIPSLSYNFKF